MVKYLIIEDERLAYEELKRMVSLQRPDYVLAGWCDSIEQAKLQISSGNIDLIHKTANGLRNRDPESLKLGPVLS